MRVKNEKNRVLLMKGKSIFAKTEWFPPDGLDEGGIIIDAVDYPLDDLSVLEDFLESSLWLVRERRMKR